MADAQIILSQSRDTGIVAIASGDRYPWAHTALTETGFRRGEDGVYHIPADVAHVTVGSLVRCAERHRTSVHTNNRRFIGDAARDIARLLPGRWSAKIEIYSHPAWQEDLVPWLWDAGELSHAIENTRIPYAAWLHRGDITLLMVERPGHDHGYIVGAFAPEPFDDNYDEPHAPVAVVVPAAAGLAARIVEGRFLPAYQRALHQRRLTTVTQALDRIREEHQILGSIRESGRYTDAVPLDPQLLPGLEGEFAQHAWLNFADVLTHAPTLLERCATTTVPGSDDATTVTRLRETLTDSQPAFDGWRRRLTELVHTPAALQPESPEEARLRLAAQVMPAIDTWLTHHTAFTRIAHATTPAGQAALPPAPAHTPALPAAPVPPVPDNPGPRR